MATTDGKTYKLVASETKQDSTSLETVTHEFRLTSGVVLPSVTTTFHRGTDESGRSTDLEETAPCPVAKELQWPAISMVGDDFSIPWWMFWASHAGSGTHSASAGNGSAVNQIGVTANYEHYWEGPQEDGTFLATTIEAQGKPSGSDGDLNRSVHNNIVGTYELTGQRKGKLDVNLSLIGGGNVAAQTSPTSGTPGFTRNHCFNFGMVHVLTHATLGYQGGTYANGTTDLFDTAITDAAAITRTELTAAPTSLTDALQSFSLRFNQTPDLTRSYAPGNLDANDAGIVPHGGSWIPSDTGSATAELELLLTQTASETVEGLMEEYEAGTRRAFEFWAVPGTVTEAGAYSGVRVTFGEMHPVSWEEVPNGFGAKDVRVVYRAGYNTAGTRGWLVAASFAEATAIGA